MEPSADLIVVAFTKEEALELFARCLKSIDDDNSASVSILRKLAKVVDSKPRDSHLVAS